MDIHYHWQTIRTTLKSWAGCQRVHCWKIAVPMGCFLLIATVTRLLLISQIPNGTIVSAGDVIMIFLFGAAYDIITFCYLASPIMLALLLLPGRWHAARWMRRLTAIGFYLFLFLLLFNAVAEWLFWQEFYARYNFVAVDYLVYTTEVIGNISESYPLPAIFLGIGLAAGVLFVFSWRRMADALKQQTAWPQRLLPVLVVVTIAVLAGCCIDDEMLKWSDNRYLIELSQNGIYNLFDAFEDNSINYDEHYLTRDPAAAIADLRQLLAADNARFISATGLDIRREITGTGEERRLNVVLIVVESLSAEFIGTLDSVDQATPNIDAIADSGVLFTRLYASGTRTDRGLEAVTLSLPPTPGRAVLKRPHNDRLFTLMEQFAQRGYDTKFLYGGFSYFDNMKAYFEGNAATVIDRSELADEEISFANIWGVCDGDMFDRTLKECDRSATAGAPFFSLVMTTSNHRPYTFPATPGIPPDGGRIAAVRYTDYAIGKFIDTARTRPWFASTIFVIVADHCANSAGKTAVELSQYRIPLIIYAPQLLAPRRIDMPASQIDIAPTLLGILNFTYTSSFFGQDLLRPHQSIALLGNYQNLGYYNDQQLVILSPRRESQAYAISDTWSQTPCPVDPRRRDEAISYYQTAYYLLSHGLYGQR